MKWNKTEQGHSGEYLGYWQSTKQNKKPKISAQLFYQEHLQTSTIIDYYIILK